MNIYFIKKSCCTENEITEIVRGYVRRIKHRLSNIPELPRLVCYVIKTLWQTYTLLWALFHKRISSYVLLQNPPAIPTIPLCWFYCLVMDSQLIIDWHNYAHTLMALSLTDKHLLVKFAKFVETFLGSKAHSNFCVSKAMKEDLRVKWKIELVFLTLVSTLRFIA